MYKGVAFVQKIVKKKVPVFHIGDTVAVGQKIKEGKKERVQMFEGVVIAKKHGTETGATFTVRKIASGVGVEKIFPLFSPVVESIKVMKKATVRRAKLYYLRTAQGKRSKLKKKDMALVAAIAPIDAPEKEVAPEEHQPEENK
jgi:large subunit ribosomal protein L19